MSSRNIKVVFSSINIAGSPHALRSPQWLGEFAQGAHCDSVEYMPVFDKLTGHTPRAVGHAVVAGLLNINSLHASFRERAESAGTNQPSKPDHQPGLAERVLSGRMGRIILPEVFESAAVMAQIQQRMGKQVPAVLYPQAQFACDRAQIADAAASRHMFQPTDHVAKLVGATNLGKFDHTMRTVRGYEYVLDTYHVRRTYGEASRGIVSDTYHSVPYMAASTTALHLSLGRTDIPGESHIPTEAEARAALHGEYSGELRDMLDVVKAWGSVGYAVIEATSGSLTELTGHAGIKDAQLAYADIADGFREYWAA